MQDVERHESDIGPDIQHGSDPERAYLTDDGMCQLGFINPVQLDSPDDGGSSGVVGPESLVLDRSMFRPNAFEHVQPQGSDSVSTALDLGENILQTRHHEGI